MCPLLLTAMCPQLTAMCPQLAARHTVCTYMLLLALSVMSSQLAAIIVILTAANATTTCAWPTH